MDDVLKRLTNKMKGSSIREGRKQAQQQHQHQHQHQQQQQQLPQSLDEESLKKLTSALGFR